MKAASDRTRSPESYRELWTAISPFAALVVLTEVGAISSVAFRISPPRGGDGSSLAMFYLLGMAAVPLLLSCLLVGYARARVVLMLVLWGCLVLTLANLAGLFETKKKAAVGLLPFVLAQGFALDRDPGIKGQQMWPHGVRQIGSRATLRESWAAWSGVSGLRT